MTDPGRKIKIVSYSADLSSNRRVVFSGMSADRVPLCRMVQETMIDQRATSGPSKRFVEHWPSSLTSM